MTTPRDSDRWATPPEVFDPLHAEFQFTLDAAAEPDTAKVARFFTPEDDGLAQDWRGETVWVNPPYSDVTPWLRKAYHSSLGGVTVVALVRHDASTRWWRDWVEGKAEVRPCEGRVKFVRPDGSRLGAYNFPTVILVYRGVASKPAPRHPDTLPVLVENLPAELIKHRQWVGWEWVKRAKWTKVPRDKHGRNARVNDAYTWATFEEIHDRYQRSWYHGIGYMLQEENGIVGIDLDKCRNPETGEIEPWAQAIIDRMHTYTEASPTKTGIRMFVKGTLPPKGRRKGKIEVYSSVRFLSLTGHRLEGTPTTIEERGDELLTFHAEVFGQQNPKPTIVTGERRPCTEADSVLIERGRAGRQGEKFRALFDLGDLSEFGGDHSSADLALACILARLTDGDMAVMHRLFESSALMRDKWREKRGALTYGEMTLTKALADYRPRSSAPASPPPDPDPVPDPPAHDDDRILELERQLAERDATISAQAATIEDQRAIIRGVTQVLESDLTSDACRVELRLAFTQHGALSRVRAAGADPVERLVDMVVTLEPFAKRINVSGDTAQKVVAAATEQGTAFKKRPIVLRANPWTNEPYETPHTFVAIIPQHDRLADTLADIATNRPEALIRKTRVQKPKAAPEVVNVPRPEPPECPDHSGSAWTEHREQAIVARCEPCQAPLQAVLVNDGAVLIATTVVSGRGDLPSPVEDRTYPTATNGRGERCGTCGGPKPLWRDCLKCAAVAAGGDA